MPIIRLFLLVALAFAALAVHAIAGSALSKLTFETSSGPRSFQIEVADTPEKRRTGLMHRRSMPADQGMLFDFDQPQDITMWMQNTYISLDMVFVGGDGRVTHVAARTEPLSTRVISSEGPARYVVELVAGAAEKIGLKRGDRVVHPRIGA